MKRFIIYGSFVLLLLFGGIGQVQAFTEIDTNPFWNGTSYISSFGYPDTATYGQVITAPTNGDVALQSFSFQMNMTDSACAFRGYVYAWDGTKATGPALFKGPIQTTLGSGAYEKIDFKAEGVILTPGAQCV